MSTMMITLLAAFGSNLFTQSDGDCKPGMRDKSCCTWSMATVGKHYERRWQCVEPKAPMPSKVRIEVKSEDRQPGDDEGFKTVGKHLEKAYYRWVDAPKETASTDCSKASAKKDCDFGMFTEGKQLVRKSICKQNGERVMCGEKAGECDVCLK